MFINPDDDTKIDIDNYISSDVILNFLLPVIIFKEGFALRKKSFFKNISHIIGFGFFGTILNIVLLSGGILLFESIFAISTNLEVRFSQVLVMAVILSNADTLAPLALIDGKKHPDMFSIVFGEGVLNDAVVLIAFGVLKTHSNDTDAYIKGSWYMIAIDFFECAIFSLCVGIFCGICSTLVNKYYRDIQGHVF